MARASWARRHRPGWAIPLPGHHVNYRGHRMQVERVWLAAEEDPSLAIDLSAGDRVMYLVGECLTCGQDEGTVATPPSSE